jgi:type I restriction enzyme S subunit
MKEQKEKYNLPKNWSEVNLEELVVLAKGKKPNLFKEEIEGSVPYLDIEGFEKNIVRQFSYSNECTMIDQNSLAMVWDGARSGLIFRGKNGAVGSTIMKITPFLIEKDYLFYFLLLKQDYLQKNTKGTGIPHVNPEILGKLKFPLSSLNEQKLILSHIDTLFSKLEEANKILKKSKNSLKIYRHALLKSSFEGDLTKKWRIGLSADANQELKNIKTKRKEKYNLELNKKEVKKIKIDFEFDFKRDNEISSWAIASLDNLINMNARIGWRGLTKKEYTTEGVLFLSVHSLNYGKNVVFKNANYISNERYEESPEIQLKENNILLCKDGAGIGKVGIIKKLPDKATVNSSLLVIDVREVFNPDFLYYFFLGPNMQRLVNEKISGSAIPHLFQKDIKKFKLKVPPMLEQNKIVEILESRFTLVDNLEKTVDNVLSEIVALRHSILKNAFAGRLVKYTSQESVVELLIQIKEEKKLYIERQKELRQNKPKQKRKMETKKSILELLKNSDTPMSAQELWEKSTSEGDIERFYSEIKEIYLQIDELKSETESLLSLKDENK